MKLFRFLKTPHLNPNATRADELIYYSVPFGLVDDLKYQQN